MISIGLPSVHSRLHKKVMAILGLEPLRDPRQLSFEGKTASVHLLRGWDIGPMVDSKRLDVAFCGLDTIRELECDVTISTAFENVSSPIALCVRASGQLPEEKLVVATEYPRLVAAHLGTRATEVIHVHGATEAFPHLRGVDGIVDIIETGDTLRMNSLVVVEHVLHTYPCCIVPRGDPAGMAGLGTLELAAHVQAALRISDVEGYR